MDFLEYLNLYEDSNLDTEELDEDEVDEGIIDDVKDVFKKKTPEEIKEIKRKRQVNRNIKDADREMAKRKKADKKQAMRDFEANRERKKNLAYGFGLE